MQFRKISFLFLLMCFASFVQGQDKLVKVVIGSGGNISSTQSSRSGITVGQTAIGVINSSETKANVGFWYTLVEFVTDVEEVGFSELDGFALEQNYPNPFQLETIIEFKIPKRTHVRLNLFDDSGKRIGILVNEELKAGKYRVRLDRKSLTSGLYFYRMETADFRKSRKCVVF